MSVIDTVTNTVSTVIRYAAAPGIGQGPYAVAVDPAHNKAFVANFYDDTVSVINTLTNTVITVIPYAARTGIGEIPRGVAVDSARSKAYVTNAGDGTVSVVDTLRNTVTTMIAGKGIGNRPIGVAVDPDHDQVYVTNADDDTVSVIKVLTSPVITSVAPPAVVVGDDFVFQFSASGSPAATFDIPVTQIPTGVTLNPATGVLEGAVSKPGVYPLTVTATNRCGTDTASYSLWVSSRSLPVFTSATPPDGYTNQTVPYSHRLEAGEAIRFGILSGSLPPGLRFDIETGTISGKPLFEGSYPVEFVAYNAIGSATINYTITIHPAD